MAYPYHNTVSKAQRISHCSLPHGVDEQHKYVFPTECSFEILSISVLSIWNRHTLNLEAKTQVMEVEKFHRPS